MWCIKSAYKMYYMAIVFVECVVMCRSNYLEKGQMQIRGIDNLDTAQRHVLPHYTKKDSVYIPRVCTSTYCKSRTLSKYHHQPAHRYVSPVPSARLNNHEYKKEKNKRKPYQHTINPYFFQNFRLQTYNEFFFDVTPLENDKRNKRAANVNSGDGNLSKNPEVQANIDKIFGSANKQNNDDTLLNDPELQANIENIFNPKPITLYTADERYKNHSNENSNNVEHENIVPAMLYVTKEQNQRNTDQRASYSKSHQYPNLQTAIVNLYGPPVDLEDNKILETKYQNDDTENTGQEHRFRSVQFLIDKYQKSVSTESVRRTNAPPRTTELAPNILNVFGTHSISAVADHSDTTESSHKVNTSDLKSGNANDTELAQIFLDVFGTPSISAAADNSDTTESSHKEDTTDLKSGNENDTETDYRFRSLMTIRNSHDRMSSGSHAHKTSIFMYLLCLPTFVLFLM